MDKCSRHGPEKSRQAQTSVRTRGACKVKVEAIHETNTSAQHSSNIFGSDGLEDEDRRKSQERNIITPAKQLEFLAERFSRNKTCGASQSLHLIGPRLLRQAGVPR